MVYRILGLHDDSDILINYRPDSLQEDNYIVNIDERDMNLI